MKRVGIIGFGSFGKFLAEKLSSHAKVLVYSHRGVNSSWYAPLEEVAACDFVVLATPLESYDEVLESIKPHMPGTSVLVDVCSVKTEPLAKIARHLPKQRVVATHPMFGPESASVSLKGHTIIMCPDVSTAEEYEFVKQFALSLELNVQEMTTEEHDRGIATVQGLTFFIAHTLEKMKIHEETLHTPSFQRLLDLAELEKHHSAELFKTIQKGNPYAADVRDRFLHIAESINESIDEA